MTQTKRSLGEHVCNELALDPREAEAAISTMFEEIRDELTEGEQVNLHGFGQFRLIDKNSRPGRNPKTGENCEISPRKVCVLKPGTWLEDAANQHAQVHAVSLVS